MPKTLAGFAPGVGTRSTGSGSRADGPFGHGGRLFWRGPVRRPPVRLSRLGALLLSALLARAAGMVGGAASPLGAGRKRRDADARQPHGGSPVSRQDPVRAGALCVGTATLHGRARGPCVLGHGGPDALLARELDWRHYRGLVLRLRWGGALGLLQHHLSCWGCVGPSGLSGGRCLAPAGTAISPRRAVFDPGDAGPRRRSGVGLFHGALRWAMLWPCRNRRWVRGLGPDRGRWHWPSSRLSGSGQDPRWCRESRARVHGRCRSSYWRHGPSAY